MAKFTKILKFGGSSVGTPKMIKKAAKIVKAASGKDHIAVVVSAFQGVTDELLSFQHSPSYAQGFGRARQERWNDKLERLKKRHIEAVKILVESKKLKVESLNYIENLFSELEGCLKKITKWTPEDLDYIASFGERLSAYIMAAHLRSLPALSGVEWVDARELVKTDNNFTNAAVDFNKTNRRIKNYFRNRRGIPVITGFLGSTSKGETTTLGRGGSDYTASIFGAALGVKTIEIWTDVNGVMSADPKLVKSAQVLPKISYEEAVEMAYFGAKVIHPATMLPAIKKGIPILIKNTFNPATPGTLIQKDLVLEPFAKGITAVDGIALIIIGGVSLAGIPGSAARVFEATKRAKANVILISQASSEHTICFAIKSSELKSVLASLKKEFKKEIKSGLVGINIILNQSVLAMIGDGMRGVPGIAGKLFKALGDSGVNVTAIAQGGSERNISFVIDAKNKVKALNLIHAEFFEGGIKNIFLVGTGNIGGTLLDQIYSIQRTSDVPSIKNFNFRTSEVQKLRVCGIIDAFNMLMDEKGINLGGWQKKLRKSEKPNLEKWLRWVKGLNLGNKILVDCTASNDIASRYIEMAEAGFHIVTPNKKFNVRPMKEYKKLREILARTGKKFLYETNVGAALPVISALQDLLKTGDKITKIEGIFSGTLSYIFNTYIGEQPFSEVVTTAKKLGYTEPDPREDLNGNDVGRKLLVLARETGLDMELKDVSIESLVPKALQRVKAPEDFLKALPKYDNYFKKLSEKAKSKNKMLRYVAKLERGRASASLLEVDLKNPLAATQDADNIFAFYTKRYNKRPLVVQGPGAGKEVTAAGVLADILRI